MKNRTANKIIRWCCFAVAGLILTACNGNNIITEDEIAGEWDIVSVKGLATDSAHRPFLGFDTQVGGLYGNAGCNMLMGTFQLGELPIKNSISFDKVATTRMLCSDMSVEDSVLSCLDEVAIVAKKGSDLQLKNNVGHTLLVLQKRPMIKTIEGRWNISLSNDNTADSTFGKTPRPYLEFDIDKMEVKGYLGCNSVNGNFGNDDKVCNSLKFGDMAVTMMECPDMENETKILNAINSTTGFKICGRNILSFTDKDDKVVLYLER